MVFDLPPMLMNSESWVRLARWLILLAVTILVVSVVFVVSLLAGGSIIGPLTTGQLVEVAVLLSIATWGFISGVARAAPGRKLTVALVLYLLMLSATAYSMLLRLVAVFLFSTMSRLAYPEARDLLAPVAMWLSVAVGGAVSLWMAHGWGRKKVVSSPVQ